ncbi:TetR/AcrR family transcriptional regulator [Nocardioides sp. NPDC101246]|uniref:TetR/AcrR family transcriptional regulator n=1 Tax=Nocardioides sp. NPDC101246 TaxID=3364336 RepID=UPI0037F8088E
MSTAAAALDGGRARPGRPRHVSVAVPPGVSPRDQILQACAKLFTSKGFAATSTREIAEAVGIRQASLYYHFAGKDEILADLLGATVRPSQDKVAQIEAEVSPTCPEAALFVLALVDIQTLADAPHNVGMLARLPDVVSAGKGEVYAGFRDELRELTSSYEAFGARLAEQCGLGDADEELGAMLIQQVEGVIVLRADGVTVDKARANKIAAGCLRLCGCGQDQISQARHFAEDFVSRHLRSGQLESR